MNNSTCQKELCINPFDSSDCIWCDSDKISTVKFPYVPITHILKLIRDCVATQSHYFITIA